MSLNQEERWLLEEKYVGEKTKGFFTDLERLAGGEPLGYVIGHVPFLGLKIFLDSKPLIPRHETEYWTEKAIAAIREAKALRVLDLCSGSGCIGLAVAKHCPSVSVTLSDISPAHHDTVTRTMVENGISPERVTIANGDLFENISGTFDFILTNPPYIDPALDRTESGVKAHEPHLALYGGQGGMELVERVITEAPKYLSPHGQLWIEHEPEQVEAIEKSAEACGFRATTYCDQYGLERYSILSKS